MTVKINFASNLFGVQGFLVIDNFNSDIEYAKSDAYDFLFKKFGINVKCGEVKKTTRRVLKNTEPFTNELQTPIKDVFWFRK